MRWPSTPRLFVARNMERHALRASDLIARGVMRSPWVMLGLAFDDAKVGLVHAIAHTVGARHQVHHGRRTRSRRLTSSVRVTSPRRPRQTAKGGLGDVPTHGDRRAMEDRRRRCGRHADPFIVRPEDASALPMLLGGAREKARDIDFTAEFTLSHRSVVDLAKAATDPAEVMRVLHAVLRSRRAAAEGDDAIGSIAIPLERVIDVGETSREGRFEGDEEVDRILMTTRSRPRWRCRDLTRDHLDGPHDDKIDHSSTKKMMKTLDGS